MVQIENYVGVVMPRSITHGERALQNDFDLVDRRYGCRPATNVREVTRRIKEARSWWLYYAANPLASFGRESSGSIRPRMNWLYMGAS